MSWVIWILLYLCVGCLIVSFVLRPDKSYRKFIDDKAEQNGGTLPTGMKAIVAMTVVAAPIYVVIVFVLTPFTMRQKKKARIRDVHYHTVYRKMMGYGDQSLGICELCHNPYSHVHHVQIKGMGGRKDADGEDNLIGLCRMCHDRCHGADWRNMKAKCLQAIGKRNRFLKKKRSGNQRPQ